MTTDEQPPGPLLRVVTGEPSADELAALVAVVTSRGGSPTPEPPAPRSAWAAKSRLVRPPLRPGPTAWRASAWPR
ncbi:MAG TPA: acyl-CoA carboxylase subunit epsilon [Actinomycetes bacterium]|nr:acyl-CoA carboxylase subunit epsilon [Actinomycetes bacterium]